MTDDCFFIHIGRWMAVFGLCVVVILTIYAMTQLYQADQSYQHDTTPLLAPDTTRKAGK